MLLKLRTCITALAACLLISSCASGAVKTSAMERLAQMLAGEFDSQKQMEEDKANGVPKDMAHGWVNRLFLRVDAPALDDVVLVGSTSYGGDSWYFDKNEFLVWTFQYTPGGTIMSPRRFKDQDKRVPYSRDASKLAGFGPADLEAAKGGANCKIKWTETKTGFSGRSEPCQVMSVVHKKMLSWVWSYQLEDDLLYIAFSGTDENGVVLDGSPDDIPYRLERIR